MKEIAKSINPNWYSITLIELVVFGTLMLFIKELPEVWKSYLLPSLIVHFDQRFEIDPGGGAGKNHRAH